MRLMKWTAACLMLAAACLGAAAAEADYPNRTIKIIESTPPGTTADLLTRIIGERLSAVWGQPVVVENRPGGAMNVGADAVAKATPDGYTLLSTPPSPLAINQYLYSKLPFDPNAFVPVTIMAQSPNVLMVHPKVPAANLKELVAYAKANPGKMTYGSSGAGSTPHLTMALLANLSGLDLIHVPYRGMSPAFTDLLGGHIDMMFFNLGNIVEAARTGRLHALGIASKERDPSMPDVPAIAEVFPGFQSVAWFAIVAPPGTSPEIAGKLAAAMRDIMREPDVIKKFAEQYSTPMASTPGETAAFIKEEQERWRKVIAAAGIKPE